MTNSILTVDRLSHRYSRHWAIQDISFDIGETGIHGLLGSNGAGKSTTMNIICGVLNQTKGTVTINGIDLRRYPEAAKKEIGFLPQTAPLHLDLTVDEYLRHCAYLRLMDRRQIPQAVDRVKVRCGVTHHSKRLIRNLSGGYKQRVGIAQAIIHQPKLVILDEPTNGLDPNQIVEVRELIREIGSERAVILSSHILSEIQATCQYIKMIDGGQMVFNDTMEAFSNYLSPDSLLVWFHQPPVVEELEALPGVTGAELIQPNQFRVRFDAPRSITERLVELSVQKGWQLREIMLEKSSVDEVFARLSHQQKSN